MAKKHSLWKFWWWFGANPAWELVKFIGGTAIVSALWTVLKNEIHRHPIDWILLTCLLVCGSFLIVMAVFFERKSRIEEQLNPEPIASAECEEIKGLETALYDSARSNLQYRDERDRCQEEKRELQKQFDELFTPLQIEAFQVAVALRKLIDEVGPSP